MHYLHFILLAITAICIPKEKMRAETAYNASEEAIQMSVFFFIKFFKLYTMDSNMDVWPPLSCLIFSFYCRMMRLLSLCYSDNSCHEIYFTGLLWKGPFA